MLDINENMLKVGESRAVKMGYTKRKKQKTMDLTYAFLVHNITFQQGNAQDLNGIPSNSMDVYSIAFGIRNCTDIPLVLSEAYRVLKPGGRFMCMEFSRVNNDILRRLNY